MKEISANLNDGVGDRLELLHLQSEQLVVHPDCRKTYVKRKTNDSSDPPYAIPSKKLRSEVDHFEWNVHCFICGEEAPIDDRHSYVTDCEMYKRSVVVEARTLSLKTTILRHCSRLGDSAENVFNRVNGVSDLVAAGARYHKQCYHKFCLSSPSEEKSGRPVSDSNRWFLALCDWLETEGDAEIYSLAELHTIMTELAKGEPVYSEKYLRDKLITHYGSHVFFGKMGGSRKDVVCFKNMASYLINDEW